MATARQRFTATFGVLRIPDMRKLWLAQALSEVGDWAARLALAILVLDQSGSAFWSAATLAVSYLPYLLSPILTPIAQRWSLRRLMIGTDVLRMAVYALIAIPLPTWSLLVLAFAAGIATPPFEAARVAIVPQVAGEERMGDAIALTNITFQVAQVLGFSLAGVLLFTIGPVPAILFNAATFGVSALLLVGVKGGRQPPDPEPPIERSRRALRAATRNPLLRRVLAIVLLLAFADAAVNALLPVFVRTNDYSPLLLTALAVTAPLVGALSGSVVPRDGANLYLLRISAKFTVIGGGGAAVLLLLIGSGATWRGALVAMMAIVAFGVTIAADIPTMTAAMRAVDDDLRAPLVAVVQPALMGIQAVGALAAGAAAVLIPATSAMAAALLLPVGYGLWVLLRPVEDLATIDLTQSTSPPPSRVTLDVAEQHARSKTGDDFVS